MYDYNYGLAHTMIGYYGYEYDRRLFVIMQRFLNLYMKRFNYEGFTDEFKKLYGNRSMWLYYLFFAPAVAWFHTADGKLMCLPVSGDWKYNAAGKPTHWRVWAINGKFSMELNENNSVLMFNDEALSIPYIQLMYEARYMRKLDMAMEQNIELQSTPWVIEANDENVKDGNRWINLLKEFKSRIVIRKKRDKNAGDLPPSQVLKTDVPLQINDYNAAYNDFLFRALTYLGFKNVNIEKSERLLTGEISANDMVLQTNFTNSFDMQVKCFEEIKATLGDNITVTPAKLETLTPDLTAVYAGMPNGGNVLNKGGSNNENEGIKA